jgi:hypothetical protein
VTEDQLAQLHEAMRARTNGEIEAPCILCDRPTRSFGVMCTDKHEWGAPQGKQRFIFYPLCDLCQTDRAKGDVATAIERELWERRPLSPTI